MTVSRIKARPRLSKPLAFLSLYTTHTETAVLANSGRKISKKSRPKKDAKKPLRSIRNSFREIPVYRQRGKPSVVFRFAEFYCRVYGPLNNRKIAVGTYGEFQVYALALAGTAFFCRFRVEVPLCGQLAQAHYLIKNRQARQRPAVLDIV
jgi:hypothetical protein